MKTIKVKELGVPVEAMGEVAEILADNEITNSITGVNEAQTTVFVEVSYGKGDNQFIHKILDVIEDYRGDDDDDEEEDND